MIWRPWREIRRLQDERRVFTTTLEALQSDHDAWEHTAELMADRYDKIRETNRQLRAALALYRNGA